MSYDDMANHYKKHFEEIKERDDTRQKDSDSNKSDNV